jgi:casein kinase II subunit beta
MREKYLSGRFGICPRVLCEKHNVLPVGMTDELRTSRVKIFCPRCEDVYIPKQRYADVDGAYFGTSFPHMLLQSYDDLHSEAPKSAYLPRLYGFQVYGRKGSKYEKGGHKL